MPQYSGPRVAPSSRERQPTHPPILLTADALFAADYLIADHYARTGVVRTRAEVIAAALQVAMWAESEQAIGHIGLTKPA